MTSSIGPTSTDNAPPQAPASGEPDWATLADGVRLIVLRRFNDPTLADDIAQEAVARAIAAVASRRSETIGDMGAFVYGIACHLIADLHRAQSRTVPFDAVAEPADDRVSALDAVVADDEQQQVQGALRALLPEDRKLIELFFIDGLDADAVALRLSESAVNIRKRKSRALERLRRAVRGRSQTGGGSD